MNYSVLMSVYKNEKVECFIQAVDSLLNQTIQPEQIVLVRDGGVYEELQNVIDKYVSDYPDVFTYLPLEQNGGLGNALRYGLTYCRNELVGRMDTDDISVPNRFERQLEFMKSNPDVDIVGGNIAEFNNTPEIIVDYRCVPSTDEEIKQRLKVRSPFNHQTVMFKKRAVLDAGNYEHFYLFEDWYLWVRMLLSGCTFGNLNEVLCYVRISEMANRRGGLKYYKSCKTLLKYMKRNNVIGSLTYLKSRFMRFVGYVLLPNKAREVAYKKMLRNNQHVVPNKQAEKMLSN